MTLHNSSFIFLWKFSIILVTIGQVVYPSGDCIYPIILTNIQVIFLPLISLVTFSFFTASYANIFLSLYLCCKQTFFSFKPCWSDQFSESLTAFHLEKWKILPNSSFSHFSMMFWEVSPKTVYSPFSFPSHSNSYHSIPFHCAGNHLNSLHRNRRQVHPEEALWD